MLDVWWLLLACASPPRLPAGDSIVPLGDTGEPLPVHRGIEGWSDPSARQDPILVVGAGPAGLAVAAAAQEVLLLEASDRLGGRGALDGMMFWLAGTSGQAERGIVDSPEQAAEDWEAITGAPPTDQTLRFLDDGPWIHDEILALGIEWSSISEDPMSRVRRLHGMGTGRALSAFLEDALPDSVELRTGSRVSRVLVEDGAAVGVEVDGERILGRAVVIATGGFVGDQDLMDRLVRQEVAWDVAVDEGATGDALTWAREHGWGTAWLGAIGWFRRYVSTRYGPVELHDSGGVMPWIWVDVSGERFVDESDIETVTTGTPCLEHAPVWGLSPRQPMIEALRDEDDLDGAMERGEVLCDPDPAVVASSIGVDIAGLAVTLEAVDVARQAELADRFGRSPETFPDFDDELCAYQLGLVAQKNFGGLAVDASGRVLDKAGQPVPGLYAVGEAAGMAQPGLGGQAGFDGALSAILWSGWRVGESIRP